MVEFWVGRLPLPKTMPPATVGNARRLDRVDTVCSLARSWRNCLASYGSAIDAGSCRLPLGGLGTTCCLPDQSAWPVRLAPGSSQRSSKQRGQTGTVCTYRHSVCRCRRAIEPSRARHREHHLSGQRCSAPDGRTLMIDAISRTYVDGRLISPICPRHHVHGGHFISTPASWSCGSHGSITACLMF
jgi:hypothetical protein